MKKIFSILSALLIVSLILTGCGEDKPKDDVKLGMIKHLNASEDEFNNFIKKVADTFSINMTTYKPVFYDNLNSMLMALDKGEIKIISTYDCVANYMVSRNPKLEIMYDDSLEFIDAFCFAMKQENESLKNSVDDFIKEIKADGTLDNLVKTYISDVNKTDPPAVGIEHFDDADTIKVAVTGDLPPLDLYLADGTPAGFNTALLAEMGKRLHKNVEIVSIDSGARASAVMSDRVDMIFWAVVPVSEIIPADADKPEGTILSAPYYRGRIVHLKLKD